MKAEVRVTLELKEIREAIIECAKASIGGNTLGGSHVEFTYAREDTRDPDTEEISGAVVTFQHQKRG